MENQMPKRFTDTELWEEDWFISLQKDHRVFWIFVKDNCDHAGIWKQNLTAFNRLFGYKVDFNQFLKAVNLDKQRVMKLKNGRYLLTGFIPFQYGVSLNLLNRFHLSVYNLLLENEVDLRSIRPQIEVIDRVKDKDKVKDKDNLLKDKGVPKSIDEVKAFFVNDLEAEKFWDYFSSNGWKIGGRAPMKDWKAAARNWIRKQIEFNKNGNPQNLSKGQLRTQASFEEFKKTREYEKKHGRNPLFEGHENPSIALPKP